MQEEKTKVNAWVKTELGPEEDASAPLTEAEIAEAKSAGSFSSLMFFRTKFGGSSTDRIQSVSERRTDQRVA
jgi:hypothetical protein